MTGVRRSHYLILTQALMVARKRLEDFNQQNGDLSVQHFWTLLSARDRPCFQKQIADTLMINLNTMVDIVDDMEKAGYVARSRNPDNRREVIVVPTPIGLETLKWMDKNFDDATRKIFYPITLEEMDLVGEKMIKILEYEGCGVGKLRGKK